MGALFANQLHEDFGTWPLAYIAAGGAEFGEIRAVATAVGEGDDAAYYDAWMAAGDRLAGEAEAALARGNRQSPRELLLRAAAYYGTSFHPLYGAPVDPRVLAAFAKQIAAFDRGLALGPQPVRPVGIPFGGASLPAYLIPAKMAEYPGNSAEQWRSYFLCLMPIGDPVSLQRLFVGFRNAGLPV